MSEPVLPNPPERPVVTAPKVDFFSIVHRLRNWLKTPEGLTLLVLAFQTLIIYRQANIMDQQTTLMGREAGITETQQKLASRPNVVTSLDRYIWKIENKGPYSVHDLRVRVLHFKKFINLGWHGQFPGEEWIFGVLEAGKATTVDLSTRFFPYSIKDRSGNDYTPVQFAEFYVAALVFKREVDDKRYLYLQPFWVRSPGDPPEMLISALTDTAGPVDRACMMDAYAVELTHEFYKRNPLPYPVEPYNYHYLLGIPAATCLQTGPNSMRW